MTDTPDPRPQDPRPPERRPRDVGSTTQVGGTPMAVDLESDPSTRRAMAMFVAGPVVWFAHFMVVYLVAEAGCTGDGPGLSVFDPPAVAIITIAATVVAVLACLWIARWEYRRWRAGRARVERDGEAEPQLADDRHGGPLAFVGMLLALVSLLSVLFVGLPALVLTGC
ncbi:hypothetical protein [Salsipaludibacter albus]|uniref:hypothetical protein n=1 Tax=Salsipaludibacter albus TaxID=2849650 RepID=UPI001EE4064D|nr:hypothetical protein [Salsipaludibacter albus]MBY5164372.1 hypothetical protein [Salsipaludibacter albus]